MSDPSLKSQLEMSVIAPFVDELKRRGVEIVGSSKPGNPNKFEPDVLCETDSGVTLGIETTAGHYSETEAKWLWAIFRGSLEDSPRWIRSGEDPHVTIRRLPRPLMNFTDTLIAAMRVLVARKSGKKYVVPTYLLIDLRGAFLNTSERAAELVDAIELPAESSFLGVFLAVNRNWSSEIDFFELD